MNPATLSATAHAAATGTRRPNVLVLMVDQQRQDTLGCYGGFGSQVCRTPRLDQLAAEGVRFERAYTAAPLCSPARASLQTGLWPTHHGILFNTGSRDLGTFRNARVGDGVPALGRLLRDEEYHTAYFGKWHCGPDADIPRLGYDEGPHATDLQSVQIPGPGTYPKIDPVVRRWARGPTVYSAVTTADGDDYREIWYCNRAQEWLRAHAASRQDQPFLCFLSLPGPHWPCIPPERYAALYDWRTVPLPGNLDDPLTGKPASHRVYRDEAGDSSSVTDDEWRKCLARYYACVTLIDEHFGRTLDVLEETGQARDTLVIYIADHGDIMGAHRLFDKGPFMYEETVAIPLIMRWPEGMPAGLTVAPFVSTIDVLPTILEAIGMGAPDELDGRSLWPLIHGTAAGDAGAPNWPDDAYSQFFGHGEGRGLYDVRMLRTDRHKFVYYPHDIDELYDTREDPWELRNLALEREWQPLREELQARLVRRMHEADDPLRNWMKERPTSRGIDTGSLVNESR
jgi:arylsulfatase A-like enzyme